MHKFIGNHQVTSSCSMHHHSFFVEFQRQHYPGSTRSSMKHSGMDKESVSGRSRQSSVVSQPLKISGLSYAFSSSTLPKTVIIPAGELMILPFHFITNGFLNLLTKMFYLWTDFLKSTKTKDHNLGIAYSCPV